MSNTILSTQSGERLSFYKLFAEKGYRLMIPIIQRDYVQGRQSTQEVRETFLQALYDYLDENKPNRDLDFVYGSLNTLHQTKDFIPLDGQQRLTTLFLLHWYLAQISENMPNLRETIFEENKSKFSYETRSSSAEFCDALIDHDIDFHELLIPDEGRDNSLSKTIANSSWYYLSWKYDPTIQSMLTMLDAIHKKFAGKPEFFERLIDEEQPIITFLFLNLKEFKLTDDLYIKMNSRGKLLTAFENFNAKFEQHLDNLDKPYYLTRGSATEKVTIKEYFSYKIDMDWANLFWNYRTLQNRSKNEKDDNLDDELSNFIRVIFANQYATSVKDIDDSLEYLLGTQNAKKRKDYTHLISFHKYKELNALSGESVLSLIDSFDNLVNGNDKIKSHISDFYQFYYDEHQVFENALKHNFTNNQERVCFHAYVRYLILNKDRKGIEQWMRVIHNLTYNTIIDGTPEFTRAVKSIENLLPHSATIIDYLQGNNKIEFFSSWQVLEEKIKAHLLDKSTNEWKTQIENTEKQSYFKGQIGFILEFSGIVDYYNEHGNCDWADDEEKKFFESFVTYSQKAIAIFENKNQKYNSDFVWERAVLTKGCYPLKFKGDSVTQKNKINLLHTDVASNNIARDFSWKRLLRIEENEREKIFVKQVFDDDRLKIDSSDNLKKSLESICKDKTNDWRDYFINYPELMSYCEKGFIVVTNEDKEIYLLSSIYRGANQYYVEMYSYFIFKQYFEKKDLSPFKDIWYNYVKGIEEDACIVLSDYCHNRIQYEINIYYCCNDTLLNPYEIAFRKSKGENKPEVYGDDIKTLLKEYEFEWNEDYSGYFFTSESEDKIVQKVLSFCKNLKEL